MIDQHHSYPPQEKQRAPQEKRLSMWIIATTLMLSSSAFANGFYTDEPGYAPGETISIHASVDTPTDVIFRLVKLDSWEEAARTPIVNVGPQETRMGSFLEVPGVDLGGSTAFSIEGWFLPTLTTGDTVVIAGQFGLVSAATGLGLTEEGLPFFYLGETSTFDEGRSLVGSNPLVLDEWVHLAATYDGASAVLYVDGVAAANAEMSNAVPQTSLPFRLGARSSAPGDLTGIVDGRLDSWTLWGRALSAAEVVARRQQGLSDENPIPTSLGVEFFFDFEDEYGSSFIDRSANTYVANVVNHGTPGVNGVVGSGRALRLNHDQIVDAQWDQVSTLTIPADAPSGFYAVHVMPGPTFDIEQRDASMVAGIVVRPAELAAQPVAVIVPVNTWNAYSDWPGNTVMITPRHRNGVEIEGGNNSAYNEMGDGVSKAYFQGWRRPNSRSHVMLENALGYHPHAIMTRHLVRWLDDVGIDYAVYTDWDLAAGRVADSHETLIFHGHHEYWSRPQLDAANAFLDNGKSLLNLGGNVLTWRVSEGVHGVQEVRKWPQSGGEDLLAYNAVDRERAGLWRAIGICEDDDGDVLLGTVIDLLTEPCDESEHGTSSCFGKWRVDAPQHWLWAGVSLAEGQRIGTIPGGANAVGHEADSVVSGLLPLGIMEGSTVEILATGVDFGGAMLQLNQDLFNQTTCGALEDNAGNIDHLGLYTIGDGAVDEAGHIAYYRHRAGGRVLSVASIATAATLGHDEALTTLIHNGIRCLALHENCGDAQEGIDGGANPLVDDDIPANCSHHRQGNNASPNGAWAIVGLWVLLRRRRRH